MRRLMAWIRAHMTALVGVSQNNGRADVTRRALTRQHEAEDRQIEDARRRCEEVRRSLEDDQKWREQRT